MSSRQPFTWLNAVYSVYFGAICKCNAEDSWFEGSRAPGLTPRTDSTFLSRAASLPQPHRNDLQIAFSPFIGGFRGLREADSWSEGNRLVV